MGLAASQARLLTITSRLSSIELRQQAFANMKMRLAADQEKVSTKYTQALNNQTLTMDDVPLTYSALVANGYDVIKTGDAIPAPKVKNDVSGSGGSTGDLSFDLPFIWEGSEAYNNFVNEYGKMPNQAKSYNSVDKIVSAMGNFKYDDSSIHDGTADGIAWNSKKQNNNVFNADKRAGDARRGNTSIWDLKNKSFSELLNGEDTTIILADDGDNKGVPTEQAKSNFVFLTNTILKSVAEAFGRGDNYSDLQAYVDNNFTKNVKNNLDRGNYEVRRNDGDDKLYRDGRDQCLKGDLISGCVDKDGTNRDAFILNVSELLRELISLACSKYANNSYTTSGTADGSLKKNGQPTKLSTDTNLSITLQAEKNEKGYTYDEWMKAQDDAKSKAQTDYDTAQKEKADKADKAAEDTVSNPTTEETGSEPKELTDREKFEQQLSGNSEFLIQGLLSGYLTLVKDGKMVSLSSCTDILTEFDKSDDARAEAEYNAEMAKLNRKEKQIDDQANRLETEYKALTTEYSSVESILKDHTSKDFELFS